MSKKCYTVEQIINKLREAEMMTASGETIESVVRKLGVTKNTFYRWRKDYGGMRVDRAKRRRAIEIICEHMRLPVRRICRALGFWSSIAYEERLRERIVVLAVEYGRYGYRRITFEATMGWSLRRR